MKLGDLVILISSPNDLHSLKTDDPAYPDVQTIFDRCIGRTFPIADITLDGLIELEVGEALGVERYLHSIWVEPEHLRLQENSNDILP